jgi:hypothetical protein
MTHLSAADYSVRPISRFQALLLVREFHYAKGGPNTGVYFHGLFRGDEAEPVGVAWWLPPTKVAAESVCGDEWRSVLSLTRLVVHPSVPTNGASFLLGRSIRLIRQAGVWRHLVTYADERQGHLGQIYRATNWEYQGVRRGDPVWVDESGRQVSRKSAAHSRTRAEMEALGYRNMGVSRKHKFVMHLTRKGI